MPYRLFIAIEMPEAVKAQLATLRADIPGASWVKPNAYHLTLKFLGDGIEAAQLEQIREALTAVTSEAFTMSLQGVGRFPPNSKRAARVLWAGVNAPVALASLYRQVERAMNGIGFPPEGRDFHPHLTLARLKSFKPEPAVDRFLAAHPDFRVEPFPVSEFHLFSSVLSPQGAAYTRQASYALEG